MKQPKTVRQLEKSLERKGSHFDFQFTDNEYDYFSEIIKGYEGKSDIVDETVLPVIYELDNPSEWLDEK